MHSLRLTTFCSQVPSNVSEKQTSMMNQRHKRRQSRGMDVRYVISRLESTFERQS